MAESGAIVPADMLISAHQDEMILPADLSKGMQDMIGDGSSGGSSTTIHIHAVDAKSVKQLFMDHKSSLYGAWKSHTRAMGKMVPN